MYESFFRFRYRPFAVLPDSEAIFWTDRHRDAFSVIEVGLDRLSQITVLTGGIGTGKTTLIRHLLQTTSSAFSVGLLSNFAGERGDLLSWVLSAFGLDISEAPDAVKFRRLERFFAAELDRGRRSVLIVDEAQNLSERDLESLRLLSNMNVDEVLLMLVLVGQPQLRAKMNRSENRRLCQRIGADYHLEPLSEEETEQYIRHRCVRAGGSGDLFDAAALDEVHRISAGVPRKINVLCDLALISAYADGEHSVGCRVVRSVMDDARKHGTFGSLTEHDIVAIAQAGLAFGAETVPVVPSAVKTPSRDPMQRLTVLLDSGGGGPSRVGPVDAVAVAPALARPSALAAKRGTPALQDNVSDANALLDTPWWDDTLLFVDDPAAGNNASAPAAHRFAAARSRADQPLDGAKPLPARGPASAGGSGAFRRGAGKKIVGRSGQAASAGSGAETTARRRPERLSAPSAAVASSARGIETALRRAFAPHAGWRRVGWRGAAGIAALAASGSMAAGIAIALLPDGSSPKAPRSEATVPWTEAGGGAPKRLSQDEPRAAPATPVLAIAADRAPAAVVAAGYASEDRAPGDLRVAAGPAAPAGTAMTPQPSSATSGRSSNDSSALAAAPGASVASDPEAAFRHALDIAIEDSVAAVVAYARAALLGHARAAYYLGQIYETGDGVPVDLVIARHWYEAASAGNSRARNRLAELPQPEQGGDLTAPLPLLAQPLDAGHADFVWTSGRGADPISYVVEVSAEPRDGAIAAYPVTGSAARLPLVAGASHWRVLALDPTGGRSAASDWRKLSPAGSGRSASAGIPAGHL